MGKPFCKRPLENSLLGHKEKKEIPMSVNDQANSGLFEKLRNAYIRLHNE